VSDWGSINEMIAHGYAKDSKQAAEIAIKAGSDMDMESSAYGTFGGISSGRKVSESN
jgi:beta-glucosidase